MASLFTRKAAPKSLTKHMALWLDNTKDVADREKSHQKVVDLLKFMRKEFYGDNENDPAKPDRQDKLVASLLEEDDLIVMLLRHLKNLQGESPKDFVKIFNFLLRRGKLNNAVAYVLNRPVVITILVEGYSDAAIALYCGSMLQEVIRHEDLCKLLLTPEITETLVKLTYNDLFDIASDAFNTFKLLCTKHKNLVAKFADEHHDVFVGHFNQMIKSPNYVTQRQSLKLWGELLLERANYQLMMRYIKNSKNLVVIMGLFRSEHQVIQFEAFNVFKVFVANPDKSAGVISILYANKDKLIEFLTKMGKAAKDEEKSQQFHEEKDLLLKNLKELETPEGGRSPKSPKSTGSIPEEFAEDAKSPKADREERKE